ncbi:MAG: GGDEF domain-containing protein, partial [Clostridia bacterium]|nr:GGDEF domain-containing protein [Clostridia bacterium]
RRFPADGYYVLSSQIGNYVGDVRIREFCAPLVATGRPVLSSGTEVPGTTSLLVDNRSGMSSLMDHLIEVHGYRRLAFVKGPERHLEAIDRFEAYRDALSRHGIPFDDALVNEGDFSPNCGSEALDGLYRSGVLPVDCIVCANDETAMGIFRRYRELAAAGADIPQIRVTGFDNTLVAQQSRPGLSTVSQPFARIADEAFRRLAAPGARPREETIRFPAEYIARESCGCSHVEDMLFSDDLFVQAARNYRVHQNVQTFSLDELYSHVSAILNLCSIGDCYIVRYSEPVIYPETTSMPAQSELIYAHVGGQDAIRGVPVRFDTERLLPEGFIPTDRRFTWVVKPLFFQDEHLGYLVFEPTGEDTRNFEPVRGQISSTLKVALLLIRQREIEARLAKAVVELQEFNSKLNRLSVRDELSGLYNRRGFFEAAASLLSGQDNASPGFLVVYADVDGMKGINDTYGHAEGDEAIRAAADVLCRAFRGDDVVARMGGDEFVVLAKNVSEEHVPKIRERIETLLLEHDKNSGKPYRLDISLGFSSHRPVKPVSLEELLHDADLRLYQEKKRKHGET